MEQIRSINMSIEIDTNKDTYRNSFNNIDDANIWYGNIMDSISPNSDSGKGATIGTPAGPVNLTSLLERIVQLVQQGFDKAELVVIIDNGGDRFICKWVYS